MSVEFYLELLRKIYAVEETRIPNFSKGKFYSRILELNGTHPENDHFMVPEMLKLMVGLNHGDITHLLSDEVSYMRTNMYLQFSFIVKRIEGVTVGKMKKYRWEHYQHRYIAGLDIKISTANEMQMLVSALVLFWKEDNSWIHSKGDFDQAMVPQEFNPSSIKW